MSGISVWQRFRLWIVKIIFPEYAAAESELRKLHDEVVQLGIERDAWKESCKELAKKAGVWVEGEALG